MFKKYLLGWVAGYVLEGVAGENTFYIEEKKEYQDVNKQWYGIMETKVFPTKEKAIAAIKKERPNKPSFVRGMQYSTPNPENAKGLPEWKEEYWEHIPVNG